MSKSVSLSGNQELQFVTDSWEKTVTVYLFDTISDTRVTLTEFYNGRWQRVLAICLDKRRQDGQVYGLGSISKGCTATSKQTSC